MLGRSARLLLLGMFLLEGLGGLFQFSQSLMDILEFGFQLLATGDNAPRGSLPERP